MLVLKQIEDLLQDRNLSEISRRTGIPPSTIWRIANGQGESVEYKTIERLSDYLEQKSGE